MGSGRKPNRRQLRAPGYRLRCIPATSLTNLTAPSEQHPDANSMPRSACLIGVGLSAPGREMDGRQKNMWGKNPISNRRCTVSLRKPCLIRLRQLRASATPHHRTTALRSRLHCTIVCFRSGRYGGHAADMAVQQESCSHPIWERNATRFAGSKRQDCEDASRVPSRWRHERIAAKTTTSPGFLRAVHDKRHLVYIVDQDALDSGPA